MKKIMMVTTIASLAIIASVMSYRLWGDYRQAHNAETALTKMEVNKPERFKAQIPPEAGLTSESPIQLVVSLNNDGSLRLNTQEPGTISDVGQWRARLEQVFRERGEQLPDRTVFVRAPHTLKYEEISKVIDAVKQAGAHPVRLRVNAL